MQTDDECDPETSTVSRTFVEQPAAIRMTGIPTKWTGKSKQRNSLLTLKGEGMSEGVDECGLRMGEIVWEIV